MKFIDSVFQKLRSHPKRVVFPEGTEPRILAAAAEFVHLQLGVAVLLGKREEIEAAAEKAKVSLNKILIIDPEKAEDLPLFVKRLSALSRYKGIAETEAAKIVTNPNYFGALMLQNGQVDGLVGGATSNSGSILRPLFQLIKPLPGIKSISSCVVLQVPRTEYGENGVFTFADCGVIPNPNVEQLAMIATESARLFRQLTGGIPRVAMLSYSTKGSAQTQDTEKIVAATALARQQLFDKMQPGEIDGELQVDTALVKDIADIKAPGSPVAGQANVLVFPDLNSGNIAVKLTHRLAGGEAYGQILLGLDKPAADLSRGASVHEIVGVAAIVSLQAVEYRRLYPDQGAGRYDPAPAGTNA
ncbi:MAG TPA: phosphate acyltransferase [Candidatus Methylacidiphilales bacterium]|jgi:phosphate acetyltransferase|nr:phosphate acyltransferase [Candidatus Methylacidiphilales bacterium]